MSYRVFLPSDILLPFVKSLAISENEAAGQYRVLPGTSIVMGFQYSGSISYLCEDKVVPLSGAGITGLMDTFRTFRNAGETGTVLVMFSETGAAAFFSTPLHELFNVSHSLDDLVLKSQMDIVAEQLNEAKTDIARIVVVEAFLISRIDHGKKDELINMAVALIHSHSGNIRISALAGHLFISQGRLEKRFRKAVGASPKKYASIVRINSLLKQPSKGNNFTQHGLEAGYFDQSHFIKDFKSFTGATPEEYFKSK